MGGMTGYCNLFGGDWCLPHGDTGGDPLVTQDLFLKWSEELPPTGPERWEKVCDRMGTLVGKRNVHVLQVVEIK